MMTKRLKERVRQFVIGCIRKEMKNYVTAEQILATCESAEFLNKMPKECQMFNNKFELLKCAIENVESTEDALYMEFGVFKGETINYIAEIASNKTICGFDCFEGLPEYWRKGFEKGTFSINGLPEVKKNVQLFKGYFEDTIPVFLKENRKKIAFIHVDCDLYSSTKCIFDSLEELITTGTVIVFDEFLNYFGWKEGEYKAWNEFVAKNNINYEYLGYVGNDEQLAVIIK